MLGLKYMLHSLPHPDLKKPNFQLFIKNSYFLVEEIKIIVKVFKFKK